MKRYGASPARTYEFAADPGRTLDEIAADEETAGHTEGQLARDLQRARQQLEDVTLLVRLVKLAEDHGNPETVALCGALDRIISEEPDLLEQSDAGVDLTTGDVEVPDDPAEAV